MNQPLQSEIKSYSNQDIDERINWYSPAAIAYNQTRPKYPKQLISEVVELAQLSPTSRILEIGCGPATATVSFAELGFSMLCLEPNPDFYVLAQKNCQSYPNVEIQNTTFEAWIPESQKFDAVIAATSFLWIPPEIGYPKVAEILKKDGHLILLWNKELQPDYEVWRSLSEIYLAHAPRLYRYEDLQTQLEILKKLGQTAMDYSERFQNHCSGHIECELTYTTEQYLMLLQTYSPYLKLDAQVRSILFEQLKTLIDSNYEGILKLSYLSAFDIYSQFEGNKIQA
jgi:SAM-dependent methyltransferase